MDESLLETTAGGRASDRARGLRPVVGGATAAGLAPYALTVVIFLAAHLTLVGSFWPYMIPFSVTIWDAAAPPQSLTFLFYGAGVVVFPVVLIYTIAVYWIFRGKVHDADAMIAGRQSD